MVVEISGGRPYGPPGFLQTGPAQARLLPGRNLVQFSHVDGCGGSGGCVAVYADRSATTAFDPAVVRATIGP
jgi:hypothetical protein